MGVERSEVTLASGPGGGLAGTAGKPNLQLLTGSNTQRAGKSGSNKKALLYAARMLKLILG